MDTPISVEHERVDDIPLILALTEKLKLAAVVDEVLGRHGNRQGLSLGTLATGWIAYILSESDHRKSAVEVWASQHEYSLGRLLDPAVRRVDFSDDRLGRLLELLAQADRWSAIEARLWRHTTLVYDLRPSAIRLDTTTSYGYHAIEPDGLMQLGHSKDHRPDLGQFKLMAAAAEPSGQLIGADVHPGQRADDGLYVPLIRRVRVMLGQPGLLWIGDSKMAAHKTRGEVAAAGDYYLMPAPDTGRVAQSRAAWIEAVLAGTTPPTLIAGPAGDDAVGAEHQRRLTADGATGPVSWTERIVVVRSPALAERRIAQLDERLERASQALLALTPTPGRGRGQWREAQAFLAAVKEVGTRHQVAGLLAIEAAEVGDPTPAEPTRRRFVVRDVKRDEAAIAARKERLGWRVLLTNLPAADYSVADIVALYANGWLIELDFHLLKDRPLGIQPLYVQTDEQIRGLTHLLTLALRVLTLLQLQVRSSLAKGGTQLAGLYAGQPKRSTARPTGRRLLEAFHRAEITLTRVVTGDVEHWHLTELSELLQSILAHAGLSPIVYTDLVIDSS